MTNDVPHIVVDYGILGRYGESESLVVQVERDVMSGLVFTHRSQERTCTRSWSHRVSRGHQASRARRPDHQGGQ